MQYLGINPDPSCKKNLLTYKISRRGGEGAGFIWLPVYSFPHPQPVHYSEGVKNSQIGCKTHYSSKKSCRLVSALKFCSSSSPILIGQTDLLPLSQYLWKMIRHPPPPHTHTLGSDVTIHLVGVFVLVWCRTMHVGAELAPWWWHQSISSEILTHLKKEHFSGSKIDRGRAFSYRQAWTL